MRIKQGIALLGVTAAAGLVSTPGAQAAGACGNDFSGTTACPVNSPGNYPGQLTADNENDYYEFFARAGTNLNVTVTDTEDPNCYDGWECGWADVELLDASSGDVVDQSTTSTPNNDITVPGKFSHVLESTGDYFLVVSGSQGADSNDNPTAVPYMLSVNASPGVQWPAPPPTRTVCKKVRWKRVKRHHRRVWLYHKVCTLQQT